MKHPVFQKIETANSPDFGDILSKSFILFKKAWVEGMLHVLLILGLMIPLFILLYAPLIPLLIDSVQNGRDFNPFQEYSLLLIIGYFFVFLILMIISQVFNYAIMAHLYKVLKKADTGSTQEIGGYFSCLKRDFGKLFVLSLAGIGIALLATILCYLPLIYAMVPLQLLVVIYAYNPELSVSEIVKASFKLGNRFWLIIFGLMIIGGLISQIGVVLCFVGVVATASFVHFPMYFFYKDTVGFEKAPIQ